MEQINVHIIKEDRKQSIPNDDWNQHLRCGSFEKCEWADDF